MKQTSIFVVLVGLVTSSNAAVHDLVVGTFLGTSLYSLQFDDMSLKMRLTANTTVPGPSNWITLSVRI
jgi:hypothetical protein